MTFGTPSRHPKFQESLRSGDLVDEPTFVARSGLDREGLARALSAGKLFSVTDGHQRAYPAFFIDETVPLLSVQDLCVAMGHLSGNVKWLFWTQKRGSLTTQQGITRTPLEALLEGDLDLVRRCAEARALE